MELKFTIRGEPKGKGRPKFSRQGNIVRTYTPDTTANYENYTCKYIKETATADAR